jgi:hypothetical protein
MRIALAMSLLIASALLAQSQTDTGPYVYGPFPAANANSDTTPKVMRVCTAPNGKPDQKSCDTWTYAQGHYNPAHPQNPPAILVLEKLTKENIVLRLANPAVPGLNGTFKGMIGSCPPTATAPLRV